MDVDEMGWGPFKETWLNQHFGDAPDQRAFYDGLFAKYVVPILAYKEAECKEPVPISDFNAVQSLCKVRRGGVGEGKGV